MHGSDGVNNGLIVAVVCSVSCPASLIIDSYDAATALRDGGVPTIGGWQTPVEKDCLAVLLRGRQPVTVCPARGAWRMPPKALRAGIAEGRVRVLSPFGAQERRMTAALAERRNAFVLEQAGAVLVLHATPGGRTEALARTALVAGKPVATLDHEANAHLVALGAMALRPDDRRLLRPHLWNTAPARG